MSTPQPPLLPVDPAGIPAELQRVPHWLTWRAEWNADTERWNKIPTNPRTGRNASTTNPATWGTFAAAVRAWRAGADGIGFVFTADDPFCGIDLDDARDPATGELAPWAAAIVERVDSYSEPSVSGTGIHIMMRGTLPDGCGARIAGHETYQDKRFFTFTGQPLPGHAEIHERTAALAAWRRETAKEPEASARAQRTAASTGGASAEDAAILDRVRRTPLGARLLAGDWKPDYKSGSDADQALANMLVWACADEDQAARLLSAHSMVSDEAKRTRASYIHPTVAKAVAKVTDRYTEITAHGQRVGQNGEHMAGLHAAGNDHAETTEASCPVLLAEARRRIAQLERQLAAITAERDRWQAEATSSRTVMSAQQRIRENAGLGQARNLATTLVNLFAHHESAETLPEDGMRQIPVMAIAEPSGCKEDAARRQRDNLVSAGLLRCELRPVPIEHADPDTGEIVTVMEKRQFLGMPEDCADVIDFAERLARARIERKPWGGERPKPGINAPCPDCGEIAGVIVTTVTACRGCRAVLDSADTTIAPTIAEEAPRESTAQPNTATPTRILRGGGLSPHVDSVTKGPQDAGWGVIDPARAPLAAAWLAGQSLGRHGPAPFDRWTDIKTG